MARFSYTVVLEADPDTGGFAVSVPALPGCVTQGDTVEEALAMVEDAIRVWLHGEPPRPEPDGVKAMVATVTVEVDVVGGMVRSPGITEVVAGSAASA
jgi:antitoxin HicB